VGVGDGVGVGVGDGVGVGVGDGVGVGVGDGVGVGSGVAFRTATVVVRAMTTTRRRPSPSRTGRDWRRCMREPS
jgi:hypothetical protein